jgi:hypothetical protein
MGRLEGVSVTARRKCILGHMARDRVENVSATGPLSEALAELFRRLAMADDESVTLVFDVAWEPTMDVVGPLERGIEELPALETLTLVHPSAAMTVIASAVASRTDTVCVRTKRSLYDDPEDDEVDATQSNTWFGMQANEPLEAFVRKSVAEAHARAVRRFALVFTPESRPTLALADVLVEELVQSGVKEIGLIHPSVRLDVIAASVRLRLASVKIAVATEGREQADDS